MTIIDKEIKDPSGNNILKLKIYTTAEECFEAFWHCPISEIEEMGGVGEGGDEITISAKDALSNIVRVGCWGFCDNKNVIHVWLSNECEMSDLVHMLAHERGHTLRPFHRDDEAEERKSEKYGEVARFAFTIANQLKELKY